MIRPKGMQVPGIVATALLMLAGHAFEARAALSWDFSLGGGALRNDNLRLDPEPAVEGDRAPAEETIYAGAAGLNLDWSGQRDSLRGTYQGQYWEFTGDENLDPLWLHTLTADLSWRRWSPFFLEAREERGRIPRTQEREGVAVIEMIDRNRVSGRTGLSRALGSLGSLEAAYRGEVEAFSGVEDADKVQRQFGEAQARYRWNPLVETRLRAAYGWVDRRLAADYTELDLEAGVERRLSERLRLRLGVEWIRDDEDAPPQGEGAPAPAAPMVRTSVLKQAELRWETPAVGSWWLGYQDDLEAQPDGDTLLSGRAFAGLLLGARLGSTLEAGGWYEERRFRLSGRKDTAWGPTLRVRWTIAPWAAFDLGGSWTSTTIRDTGLPEVEDRIADATAGAVVVLGGHVTLEVGYRFQQNNSSDASRAYTGNLVSAWLTYHVRPLAPGTVPRATGTASPGR